MQRSALGFRLGSEASGKDAAKPADGRFYGCNVSDRNNIYKEYVILLRRETHASFDRMNDKPQNQMNNKPQNMKKLLLLMAGCAALFSSCLKGYEGTSAPSTLPYYSLYINTMNQSVFSLDPFDVAFRLNTLIVEGNGDYEAAPQGVRDTLFAPGTILSYNETDSRYTLQYNGRTPHMKNDYTRMGDLIIKTNGYATLTEPGARWNIEFPSETKYRIVDGSASVSMTSTSYIVSLTSTNQWAVTMSGMATTQSASNLSSDWNGTYRIVQLSGDQTYDAIKASHYTISTEILYGKSMYEMYTSSDKNELRINASTSVPFYYNPECSTRNPVAQGKLTIYLASDVAGQYPIDIELLGENNPKLCNPKTKVTIGEYSDEYGGSN